MVYRMVFKVDGGCRNNGNEDAIGAAACVRQLRWGGHEYRTRGLPRSYYSPTPTNQRAEITAIIMALEWALEVYNDLDGSPTLEVTIHSDSQYAVKCMDEWVYKWVKNGWTNSRGVEVVNRDLIQEASDLDDKVKVLGNVTYEWIPRENNVDADRYCNEELDDMSD